RVPPDVRGLGAPAVGVRATRSAARRRSRVGARGDRLRVLSPHLSLFDRAGWRCVRAGRVTARTRAGHACVVPGRPPGSFRRCPDRERDLPARDAALDSRPTSKMDYAAGMSTGPRGEAVRSVAIAAPAFNEAGGIERFVRSWQEALQARSLEL